MDLKVLKGDYSIYRFPVEYSVPAWAYGSDFLSVTRTVDELSVISVNTDELPDDHCKADRHWRILKVSGPLDLSLVGILAGIADVLKENEIPIFVISTFDTDYVLVKNEYLEKAITALGKAGHNIITEK